MKELLDKINLLSNRELEVLSAFSIGYPRAAKDVNEFVALEYSTISRSIEKLVKFGFLERANGLLRDDYDRKVEFKNGKPVNPPVDGDFRARGSFYIRSKEADEIIGNLLDLILLTTVIYTNVMAFIRVLFPYGKEKGFNKDKPRLESDLELMQNYLFNAFSASREKFFYKTKIDEILEGWLKVLLMAGRESWYWKLRRMFSGNDVKNFELLMGELGKSIEIENELQVKPIIDNLKNNISLNGST